MAGSSARPRARASPEGPQARVPAAGRAGHREGDLIIGKDCKSAVGTLVERTTRYVLVLHLPGGRGASSVDAAMRQAIATLPGELFRTITWDQGKEIAYHAQFTIDTGVQVEVPRAFRTVHPLGWTIWKGETFAPTEEELLTGIQG